MPHIRCRQVDADKPLQSLLLEQGWSSWSDAALGPCLRYIYGSQLRWMVPPEWGEYFELAIQHFPLSPFRTPNHEEFR